MAAPKVAHDPPRTAATGPSNGNHTSNGNGDDTPMNGLVFYIGLGLGLALAAGVRPFLPALLAGALAASGALGVAFVRGDYRFLQSGWWLLAAAAALVLAYLAQLSLGPERFEAGPWAAALAGLGIGAGALLFAGTLAAHHDSPWPGLVGGAVVAALAQALVRPLAQRTRSRLPDRASREAVSVYLDAVALVLAVLICLLHPLGYVAAALFAWMWLRGRGRSERKYAGLRVLRR